MDSDSHLHERLTDIILNKTVLVSLLQRVEHLGLEEWYLSGGCIRNEVWNHLHGFAPLTHVNDFDFTYVGAEEQLFYEHEGLRVEWSNREHVHEWYNERQQTELTPFLTMESLCAFWPEVCSCVCITYSLGNIEIVAPYGLSDLFSCVCRPTRSHPNSYASYVQRQAKWNLANKYPKVKILT